MPDQKRVLRVLRQGDLDAIVAIDAWRVGVADPPSMSTTLRATALPIMADGIPVRGGAGATGAPDGA